jgi:hypothetical protein
MALVEGLIEHGSPELVIEAAHGFHFDLVQKICLLERFDAAARGCTDKKAQNVVQKKASELRAKLVPQLLKATDMKCDGLKGLDTMSAGSAGGASTSAGSTTTTWRSSTSSVDSASEPGSPSGGGDSPAPTPMASLDGAFKGIKDMGDEAIAPSILHALAKASDDAEGRQVIVGKLREWFVDSSEGRSVFNGLCVVEHLMEHGSPLLFTEPASLRFNLQQQVWLLQHYEQRLDWRLQSMVRSKACRLYDKLVIRFLHPVTEGPDRIKDLDAEPFDNAFAPLREWLDECYPSHSNTGSGSSSPPQLADARSRASSASRGERQLSPSERQLSSEAVAERTCSRVSGTRATAQRFFSVDDGAGVGSCESADAFFTPMPAPAVARLSSKLSL